MVEFAYESLLPIGPDATEYRLIGKDGKTMRAIDLENGKQLWSQPTNRDASVGITPDFVLVADPEKAGKLLAYGRRTGQLLLNVVSGSTVLGIGETTIIINIGRSLGPLSIGSGP